MTEAALSVCVVFGTYNRRAYLEDAVASVRANAGIDHHFVIIDGGSSDGSREWLAEQPDVTLIQQEGELTGPIRAFNLGFRYAVDRYPYVFHFNDDALLLTSGGLAHAVDIMERDAKVGAVAFELNLRGDWGFETVHGLTYSNFGVIRSDAGAAVAQAQGDPTGGDWWNPIYRAYGGDSELGCWLHRMGWTVYEGVGLRVDDLQADDELRRINDGNNPNRADSRLFHERWPNQKSIMDPDHNIPRRLPATPPPPPPDEYYKASGQRAGAEYDEALKAVRPHHCLKDPDVELPALLAAFDRAGGKRFLEIGTYRGATCAAVALAFPEAEIWTVDLPNPLSAKFNPQGRSLTGVAYRELGLTDRIHQLWMDSAHLTAPNMDIGIFDMVFVDGDHSEAAVYRDACSAHALLRDSGTILVHDYTDPSDDERPPWTQEVYRAVERFLNEQPGFERVRLPGWLVALQRKG